MTADSDTIVISPGQASVSLDLRNTTALANCVKVDSNDEGRLIFVKHWPTLSAGETLLWRVLGWLNGDHDLPSDDELTAGLDSTNVAAVDAVLVTQAGAR